MLGEFLLSVRCTKETFLRVGNYLLYPLHQEQAVKKKKHTLHQLEIVGAAFSLFTAHALYNQIILYYAILYAVLISTVA